MMRGKLAVRVLFLAAALYDGVLGAAFLIFPGVTFEICKVAPPNHMGYVQFPAAVLIIFAVMFLAIAVRPAANRRLIPYGIMLKIAYCGIVGYYWFSSSLPYVWKPFAIADLVFIALFAWAWIVLGQRPGRTP